MKFFIKLIIWLIIIFTCLLLFTSCALTPPRIKVPEPENHIMANVTIYNPGQKIQPHQTITIVDGLISDVRPAKSTDIGTVCDGCFAMPGLIDAHIHTPPRAAFGNRELFSLLYLHHGITSVRDLGAFDGDLHELVKRLNTGKLAGPRMYYCGAVLDGDPPSIPGAVLVSNAKDGRRRVAEHANRGVDCIKVYGNMSPGAFKGVSETTKQLGLPLIGHTPHSISLNNIQNFESQHFTGIPYLTKSAPKGWAYKSQDLIDMTPADIDEVLDVMLANNISFLPTNANGISRLTVSDPKRFPPSEGFKHLPEFWKFVWPTIISYPETEAAIKADLDALPVGLSFIRQAHEKGVDVLVGTDVIMPYVIPGESMYQQLQLMSDALGSNDKALHAATRINGTHIDPGMIGEIRVGAYADLLLYKKDPRDELAQIKRWDYALIGGRLYTREEVDRTLERFDRHFRGPLYTFITNTAYSVLASDYQGSEVAPRH